MTVKHLIAPSVMTLALAGLVACGTKSKKDAASNPATIATTTATEACKAEAKKIQEDEDYKFSNEALKSYAESLGIKDFDKDLTEEKCNGFAKIEFEAKDFAPANPATFKGKSFLNGLVSAERVSLAGVEDIADTTHGSNLAKETKVEGKIRENTTDGTKYLDAVKDLLEAEQPTDALAAAVKTAAEKVQLQLKAAGITSDEYVALKKLIAKTISEKPDNVTPDQLKKKVFAEGLAVISKLKNIKVLDLEGMKGIFSVAGSLKAYKNLETIDLINTNVEADAIKALVTALHKDNNKTLKTVHTAEKLGDDYDAVKVKTDKLDLKKSIDADKKKAHEDNEEK